MTVGEQQSGKGPLAGLRVIELGTIVAASFAARTLGDYGAEVIKVEAPGNPDPLRHWGQGSVNGHGLWWAVQSRNKKLVTLDLRTAQGQGLLRELCVQSDVLIENFRPGTMEKWGLGYADLAAVNPALIMARISGFGQTGPYRTRPGFAAVAEAMGGMRFINGTPEGPPLRMGLSLGDTIAGMFAVQGILAALHERSHSGRGQDIDVALTEACLAMMEGAVAEYDRLGKVRRPTGTTIKGVVPSNVYRTADNRWFVIAASEARMFRRLCAVMGQPDLPDDPRFATHDARCAHQAVLEAIVADWVAGRHAAELDEMMQDAAIAAGPVLSMDQIVEDRQFQARGAFVQHRDDEAGDFIAQGVVPRFGRTPGAVRWSGPWPAGAHNDDIFGSLLGHDDAALDDLREAGVI